MIFFVLAITVTFVVISVYFFLRTEKLQRQLIIQKRESANIYKENKALADSLALVASRHEEAARYRLKLMKEDVQQLNHEKNIEYCELISPIINNYGSVFRECIKGKGRLKKITQKCFSNNDANDFKKFISLIMQSEKQVKRYWSSNNLNGFILLVESLLLNNQGGKKSSMPKSDFQNKQVRVKKMVNDK